MGATMDMTRMGLAGRGRPEDAVRLAVLRHLGADEGWVDIMEIPFPVPFGRDVRRALVRSFAGEGVLELSRNTAYPNLLMVRITDVGRAVLSAPEAG